MKLVMKITFDPFKVSAPQLAEAISKLGVDPKDISTHSQREPKDKKA